MTDVVDGMARAVEDRRRELGITLPRFREITGLTDQALRNVRRGLRRRYAESTVMSVAGALSWEVDWYDRLLAGEEPVEVSSPGRPHGGGWAALEQHVRLQAQVEELAARVQELEAEVERLKLATDRDAL